MIFQNYFYVLFALLMSTCMATIDTMQLKCEVCRRLVEEVQRNVSSVHPSRVVQVAKARLDGNGDQQKRIVPLARTQIYLNELMDSVCGKMDNYVRATFKNNGSLIVIPLLVNGKMNPLVSQVDIVQDSDLNKSLQYYCEDIVNDIEDDLINIIQSENDSRAVYSICTGVMQLCPNKENKVEL